MTQKLPEGCHTLTPHLVVKDGDAAIAFYKKAFGAVEETRMLVPGTDQLMHASLRIGDSTLMLAGEFSGPECVSQSPLSLGGTPVTVHLYVADADETFQKAVSAGAKALMPPADMFWGDRYGKLKDPFGHEWSIATRVKDLTPEQVQAAAQEFFSKQPQPVG